ncbi:hypothetical protein SEA_IDENTITYCRISIS_41 [Mycobacterium phage IdentityCrisis]|uniref:Uncharacterized protein n=1 Tax=Mycobacterium phage IdentityCrisis TaxID=2599866 RepID=A0A5J6TH40_9CAUD|nr:hypothetical protein QEH37_gp40 [Mycobacterium phage IdentityCrisis]QFG10060.1 hypothetical protein SEA_IDENTITYCRISIS_41 [Mycobacterium phage IdentityCrisis]
MIGHILRCPACGPFGILARRRNQRAADAALIRFHSQLAAEVRAERRELWRERLAAVVAA